MLTRTASDSGLATLHLEVHRDTGAATHRVTVDKAAAEDREVLFARADQAALSLLVEEAQLAAHAGLRHSAIPRIFAAAFFAERRSFKVFCAGFFCALFGFCEPFKPISFVVLHTEGTAHLVTPATFRAGRVVPPARACSKPTVGPVPPSATLRDDVERGHGSQNQRGRPRVRLRRVPAREQRHRARVEGIPSRRPG